MPNPGPQQVYVIQHELGPVKIGRAKNPRQRLAELQVACPFKLILRKTATPYNAKQVEEYLHDRFQKYHLRGEWFDIPTEERNFEIPTHINDVGIPNVPVEISPGREMDKEWAEAFERLSRALQVTKYKTQSIKQLRTQWREIGNLDQDNDDNGNETIGSPDLQEIEEDTPTGNVRCSQCGHYFDRSELGCPVCGSGDYTDNSGR